MVNIQKVREWQAHEGAVYSVIRWGAEELVSGGADRLLRRWDAATGRLMQQWGPFSGAPFVVRAAGNEIIAGLFKAGLVVVDATAPQLLAHWDKRVSVFAVSEPFRRHVWVGMSQGYVMQWDLDEHQPREIFQLGRDSWRSVVVFDDMIWVGSSRGMMAVISPDGRLLSHWSAHQGAVFSILPIGPDQLLTAGKDGRIRRWRTATLPPTMEEEQTAHTRPIHVLAPWADYLVSGAQDKSIKIWRLAPLRSVRTIHPSFSQAAHRFSVNTVAAVSADRFVSAGEDRTIKVWAQMPSDADDTSA